MNIVNILEVNRAMSFMAEVSLVHLQANQMDIKMFMKGKLVEGVSLGMSYPIELIQSFQRTLPSVILKQKPALNSVVAIEST